MRKFLLLTVAALVAVAVTASIALAAISTTIVPANAPTGTHFSAKTSASCSVSGTDVSCSSFLLAGVGNANATANLVANYTAIVDCFNKGVNPQNAVESHQTDFSDASTSGALQPKNGKMNVPAQQASSNLPSTAPDESCPNPNWDPRIRPGSVTLQSFTYTLTFVGFSGAYITITGP